MITDTERLMTVSNYAKMKKVSATSIYNWIRAGKENKVEIDGVTFIRLKENDYRKIREKKQV